MEEFEIENIEATPETDIEPVEPDEQGVAVSDPLQRYLAEIRQYPFLSREEEKRLAIKFKEEGDLQAVTELILSHLRLAASIAMEYKNLPFNLMDLIQEGNVGLMQAIKKFDPYKDIRVSTYASWWIRAYILKYILHNWRLVKIGTTEAQRKLFFRLSKEREHLEKMGYEAGPRLLADRLDVKEQEVVEMQQRLGGWETSLDAPAGPESDETLANLLPSDQEAVDDRLAKDELQELFQEKLKEFSKTLKPRELEILNERILSENPKTLEIFGKKYKISKERVRQLEENLIKNLKKFMKQKIKDFKDIGPL
ncbi:RNA polymerase factor sigma-32 [Candidatus Manganitrophus noduliformans]|uniref:Sigma-70 family RNA polymerase sigma factor n=1 Tax=Candidatus Manganitrophus noduliformans TaxID=2606439 RepID=A0A7X6I9G4_9BACT|nr:RNA polymerase factor sigma-32 [Candidatus Manganitrophus noduliformans]NKE69309.1 sigma-70 family RNA polymerase sigma factor [Candidatus Manganitrophus noduliformans]